MSVRSICDLARSGLELADASDQRNSYWRAATTRRLSAQHAVVLQSSLVLEVVEVDLHWADLVMCGARTRLPITGL